MDYVLSLNDATADRPGLTGGKGASLAAAMRNGMPVPPGFVVTTDAYRLAMAPRLATITTLLDQIDFADPESISTQCTKIRDLVVGVDLPDAVVRDIGEALGPVGNDARVAVRSSGTAEDLAEASFAGQHDTFLNTIGRDEVVARTRDCWTSLWSDRVVSYRHEKGIESPDLAMAVVVQKMIDSEVSGVMFTANPLTEVTDETVINASWGLGEGIVSGAVAPDQFVLESATGRVKDRLIGEKATKVVMVEGSGVTEKEVPAAERDVASLSDDQLVELTRIGRLIQGSRDDWPQDIEWAFADGEFFVLQSRDITGVHFSWDAHLEDWLPEVEQIPEDALMTSKFAETYWTGAVTPLFYTVRSEEFTKATRRAHSVWGSPEIGKLRPYKYLKAEVMFRVEIDLKRYVSLTPKALRNPAVLELVPDAMKSDLASLPGSPRDVIKTFARIKLLEPNHGSYRVFKYLQDQIDNNTAEASGLDPEEIRAMTDQDLVHYVSKRMELMSQWLYDEWTLWWVHVPYAMSAFFYILTNWYDGDNPMIFSDLVAGLPQHTLTIHENTAQSNLAEAIKASPELTEMMRSHRGATFFTTVAEKALEQPDGAPAKFHDQYLAFMAEYGHRGHSDRDIYYPRRKDEPGLVYDALTTLMTAGTRDPKEIENKLIRRREEATADVIASLNKLPFSGARVATFRAVHAYVLRFFVFRDDQRGHMDRFTDSKKRAFAEVGRRLHEGGVLPGPDDYYFLSKNELMGVFETRSTDRIIHAKIAGRKRNFERYQTEWFPPEYMRGNKAVSVVAADAGPVQDHPTQRHGIPTSRGKVTGTARVIHSQQELPRVGKGDILVTRATDPGWTAAFLVIAGSVFEKGGMLAHCACISREYGIPAVMVPDAMTFISDGDVISVDGDTGLVEIVESA